MASKNWKKDYKRYSENRCTLKYTLAPPDKCFNKYVTLS